MTNFIIRWYKGKLPPIDVNSPIIRLNPPHQRNWSATLTRKFIAYLKTNYQFVVTILVALAGLILAIILAP